MSPKRTSPGRVVRRSATWSCSCKTVRRKDRTYGWQLQELGLQVAVHAYAGECL
jgi:hypothetical protein